MWDSDALELDLIIEAFSASFMVSWIVGSRGSQLPRQEGSQHQPDKCSPGEEATTAATVSHVGGPPWGWVLQALLGPQMTITPLASEVQPYERS